MSSVDHHVKYWCLSAKCGFIIQREILLFQKFLYWSNSTNLHESVTQYTCRYCELSRYHLKLLPWKKPTCWLVLLHVSLFYHPGVYFSLFKTTPVLPYYTCFIIKRETLLFYEIFFDQSDSTNFDWYVLLDAPSRQFLLNFCNLQHATTVQHCTVIL